MGRSLALTVGTACMTFEELYALAKRPVGTQGKTLMLPPV